jgi:hypothetical protein
MSLGVSVVNTRAERDGFGGWWREEDKGWVGQGGSARRRIEGGMGRVDWARCDLPGFSVAGDKEMVGALGQSHQFSFTPRLCH